MIILKQGGVSPLHQNEEGSQWGVGSPPLDIKEVGGYKILLSKAGDGSMGNLA